MPDSTPPSADPGATLPLSNRPSSTPRGQFLPDLPLPEELSALLPKGDYIVEGFLGQGGMGAVYRATQVRLQRPVAIKIMRRDQGRDHGFEDRFRREALAMAKLNHPNIVSVIDYGEAGPDYLYIVMELVEGADLMDVIRTGRMTQEMALALLPQICDALQFAHDHGIVHRDIKPSNIMLTRDGRVKMADFGLAKRYDVESSFHTQSGTGMGTPDYAAPEQFDGIGQIDHRADIYALGVMIYQMITGQLPRGVWKPPSQRADVHPKWDEIVGHAMQSDPADRYQAASEIKTDVGLIGSASPASEAEAKLPAASEVAAPVAEVPVAASHGDAPQGGRRPLARQVAPPRAQPSAAPARKSRPVAAVILGLIAMVSFYLGSVYWSRIRNSAADTTPTADVADAAAVAAVPETAPVTSVADGSIDLLALADVAKDAEGGIWKREGTDLIGADDPTARRSLGSRLGLALPVRVEGSYRLEVEFTKRGRKESVSVILPLNGERSVVANFQESSDFAGLVEVRGMNLKEAGNPTRVPNALNNEQRYRAAVEVRLKGDQADITATFEGKPLFRYQGPVADLDSRRYSMSDPARPGIKSMDPVTWHRVRIASLDGGTLTPARDDVILPGATGSGSAGVAP